MGLVIFDCDGVLVDSEGISLLALEDYLKDLGVDFATKKTGDFFRGVKLAHIMQEIELLSGVKLPTSFEQEYRERMTVRFERELEAIPGVEDVLKNLKYEFCVASSGPLAKIIKSLDITGLHKYFENRIFSSYEIKSWKPEPGIFLHAAKNMGFEPDKCIVVEDSISGVRAANLAGMKVLVYVENSNSAVLQGEGATTFSNMNELASLIDKYLN